jgi:hypothetical protein
MEPVLVTAPELQSVLDELREREPIFHKPQFGTTRQDFEAMTADKFGESVPRVADTVGSSFSILWRQEDPAQAKITGKRAIFIALRLRKIISC